MSVPRKKIVRFDDDKTTIRIMYAWDFAYRTARISEWARIVCDRLRFEKRIREVGEIVNGVLIKKYEKYQKLNCKTECTYKVK